MNLVPLGSSYISIYSAITKQTKFNVLLSIKLPKLIQCTLNFCHYFIKFIFKNELNGNIGRENTIEYVKVHFPYQINIDFLRVPFHNCKLVIINVEANVER